MGGGIILPKGRLVKGARARAIFASFLNTHDLERWFGSLPKTVEVSLVLGVTGVSALSLETVLGTR